MDASMTRPETAMKLYVSPTSPYGRICLARALLLGRNCRCKWWTRGRTRRSWRPSTR